MMMYPLDTFLYNSSQVFTHMNNDIFKKRFFFEDDFIW